LRGVLWKAAMVARRIGVRTAQECVPPLAQQR
jgi:hypothetical protein